MYRIDLIKGPLTRAPRSEKRGFPRFTPKRGAHSRTRSGKPLLVAATSLRCWSFVIMAILLIVVLGVMGCRTAGISERAETQSPPTASTQDAAAPVAEQDAGSLVAEQDATPTATPTEEGQRPE